MLKISTAILVAMVLLSACATTPAPSAGKGMVLGIKPGGPIELIIRTVDGNIQGELPFKPAYSAELTPGNHKIGPFCIVKTSFGKTMGPTDDVSLNVEAGRTYKLEASPGGNQCIVSVVTLP